MSQPHRFILYSLFILFFSGCYLFTEIIPVPLWWYYPLDQHWEFGIQTSPGLRMGWYGKLIFCLVFSLSGSILGALFLYKSKWVVPYGLSSLIDLSAMSMSIFVLYYIARSLGNLM